MDLLFDVFELSGGIAILLTGLKFITENFKAAVNGKVKAYLMAVSKSKYASALTGAVAAMVMQSSTAVNAIAASLVDGGILSLKSAAAVIIGTNIGTTVTAHIVSASFLGETGISSVGFFILFAGFILAESKKLKLRIIGKAVMGFGMIFVGIKIMSSSVKGLTEYDWFLNFFLVKSPPIILLNGFFITALCQSSSVVTSVLCILCDGSYIPIGSAVYMILGANIGSSLAVIFAAKNMNTTARLASTFNLVFNSFGAAVFFVIMIFTGDTICGLLLKTSLTRGGAVANFHTAFNIITGALALPFLTPICNLLLKLSSKGDKRPLKTASE